MIFLYFIIWLIIGASILVPTAILSAKIDNKLTKKELSKNIIITQREVSWGIIGFILWPVTEYILIKRIRRNENKT